jgi:hypothetical protein
MKNESRSVNYLSINDAAHASERARIMLIFIIVYDVRDACVEDSQVYSLPAPHSTVY